MATIRLSTGSVLIGIGVAAVAAVSLHIVDLSKLPSLQPLAAAINAPVGPSSQVTCWDSAAKGIPAWVGQAWCAENGGPPGNDKSLYDWAKAAGIYDDATNSWQPKAVPNFAGSLSVGLGSDTGI